MKTNVFHFSLAITFSFLLIIISTKNDYALENLEFNPFGNSFTGDLTYKSASLNISNYNIPQIRNNNINLIKNLNLSVVLECNEIIHIKITDKSNERWEPPFIIDSKYQEDVKNCKSQDGSKIKSLETFGFSLSENYNTTFAFSLKNPKSNETYLEFDNNNFLYSDTLILFESLLTSNNIYGLGERNHKFKLNDGLYTIWPNDTGNAVDLETGGFNLYGSQPFALHRTAKGLFVGLFYNNINAQDFKITTLANNLNNYNFNNDKNLNTKDQNAKVSFEQRTIGGIIDLYLFYGESPEEVISKYQKIIGFSALPPFWALGWQQSRWGIRNDTYLKSIVDKYESYQLPLDVVWADIDYMDEYRDFTVDKSRYGGLPNLVKYLHARDKYFVPILDIGIPFNKADKFYQLGAQMDVFLKSNYTKNYLQHIVWPGVCVFPDWFHPNSTQFWHAGLSFLFSQIEFDGIWQDMNEPAALWDNAAGRGEINSSLDPDFNEYENIPYLPGNGNIDLISHSISINAYNYLNSTSNPFLEKLLRTFNTKPLNSLMQSMKTFSFLSRNGKRPFILSRGNVAGLSKVASHWLGDNTSSFASMRDSVAGVFANQMFGFALVGADICGFNEDANDALCARWHALGAFYPFARNHNTLGAKAQEPFNAGPNTFSAARIGLSLRYSLIRYIYSKIFLMSIKGGVVFKPAFFEFKEDESLFDSDNIEKNAMIGDAFLLTPSFDAEEKDYEGYLPNAHWNAFPSGKVLRDFNKESDKGDKYLFSGKFSDINLFMRGGKIVPRQESDNPFIPNTNSLRKVSTQLIINPDNNSNASGELIFDDGHKLDTRETKDYLHLKVSLFYDIILLNVKNNFLKAKDYDYEDIKISKVVLFRADYLKNIDFVQVKLRNGEYAYVNFDEATREDVANNRISIDLSALNLRFDEIESLIIIHDGSNQQQKKKFKLLE
jgi:alpha-glucosidase (family GH31 glycosyl hydrolase)